MCAEECVFIGPKQFDFILLCSSSPLRHSTAGIVMHASCFWLGINHLLTLCALEGSLYTYGKTAAHRDH